MKLLLLGSNNVWSIDRYYFRYIQEAGVEAAMLPTLTYFLEYRNQSLMQKVLHRLGLSDVYRKIGVQVKEKVTAWEPDVVLVFKGMEILPETIRWIKERGIKLVNYNPDNPFIFTDRGSGNKNVTDAIPLYDLHLTYNHEIMEKLAAHHLRAAILPFGFEISEELYRTCTAEKEVIKACFIGTPDTTRIAFLKELADAGISFDVYGNDWDKFLVHSNVTIHKAVYGDEFWKVLRRYRVQLNLMRIHNQDSHNMRSFEVPGIGGIMVAPDTTEHRMYFEDGKEVFLYDSVAGCAAVIRSLLALPAADADSIRQAARDRSVQSGYSYRDRASQLLGDIRRLYE